MITASEKKNQFNTDCSQKEKVDSFPELWDELIIITIIENK